MNQRETINLLNSIMPDIISSKDPEGTMLKCAEAHNLSPAQLEKLGQTFNTAKTIVGLEKQANRGDSFKIVDVPELVSKYASYSPEKALSNKSKKVHEKVDSLFEDDKDGWGACVTSTKSASMLPDLNKIVADSFAQIASGVVDSTDEETYLAPGFSKNTVWQWNKSASAKEQMGSVYDLKLAKETIDQLLFEIPMDITEKCAAIKDALTPDEGRWAEAAEDITDILGEEKSASVIKVVEEYFNNVHHPYETFTKRACVRNLTRDRHGIIKLASEIVELTELLEKVAVQGQAVLVPPAANTATAASAAAPVIITIPAPSGNPGSGRKNRQGGQHAPKGNARNAANVPVIKGNSGTSEKAKEEVPAEDYTVKPVSDITALLDEMGPSLKDYVFKQEDIFNTKPIDTLESVLAKIGPSKDTRAKLIDKAIQQAQMDTTLQQLMLSDDVIAEADPSEVQEIFSTLANISPSLATDPGKMGPALKEALQYGSVPINILSDVSKLEGQLLKNEADRAVVERTKYSL